MTALVVHSANAVDVDGVRRDAWVGVAGGQIVATGTGRSWTDLAVDATTTVIDAQGLHLTPGFIDVHCHGGNGRSYDDGVDEIRAALGCHRAHGTTRSVLSLVTNPIDSLCRSLADIAALRRTDATILGAHLEGPYLNPARRGAHALRHLRVPAPAEVDRLVDAAQGALCQITLAPELPGALDATDRLVAAGVLVAVGHTDADLDAARRAFERGATILTHAFNAMAPVHHRHPGPVVAALSDERVHLEVIADGHHVHPEVVALLIEAAPSRVMLVTDAMSAACCGDGRFALGDVEVSVTGGAATVVGTDTLAGSTITQDVAIRTAVLRGGVRPEIAVAAATATPARALGVGERFGRLAVGHEGDLVLMDEGWVVQRVWVSGEPLAVTPPGA